MGNLWPASSREMFRREGAAGRVLLTVLGSGAAAGALGARRQQCCLHPAPTRESQYGETPQPKHTPIAHAGVPTLSHFYFLQSFVLCLRPQKSS